MRLIDTLYGGAGHLRLYRDAEWNEFVARVVIPVGVWNGIPDNVKDLLSDRGVVVVRGLGECVQLCAYHSGDLRDAWATGRLELSRVEGLVAASELAGA